MSERITIGIAGGSGFVGRHLARLLAGQNYEVIIFSRGKEKANADARISFARWNPDKQECDVTALGKLDALINLAGAGVLDKRWTDARRREIVSSRVDATRFLLAQLRAHAPRCRTFIAASAIGYYGPDREGLMPFTEHAPPYHDFLADVCRQWEAASLEAVGLCRTAIFRFGIVLGRDGGAYPQFAAPMRFGIMPMLGSGSQMVSWVHIEDLAAMLALALQDEHVSGIYNCVAPAPVTHRALMKTIAAAKGGLKIPVPVPAFAVQLLLGDASEEVLKSCTVSAQKIMDAGFVFQYPDIGSAVRALV